MKSKTKPPILPTAEHAKALLIEYQEQRRRGEDLSQRIRATCRLLGIDSNGWGVITPLKEALADYAVSNQWPPRREEKKK